MVFVCALPFFFKTSVKNKVLLVSWILIPYLVFTLIEYKSVRYTIPYLPAIGIISSVGILSIQAKKIRFFAIFMIVLVALLQFFAYSYGLKWLPSVCQMPLGGNQLILFNQAGSPNAMETHRQYSREDWKTAEIITVLKKFWDTNKSNCLNVFIIPDDPRIHSPLVAALYAEKIPALVYVGSWYDIASLSVDFVITKNGAWMAPPQFLKKIQASEKWFSEHRDRFERIGTISLPDTSVLSIYKRK